MQTGHPEKDGRFYFFVEFKRFILQSCNLFNLAQFVERF